MMSQQNSKDLERFVLLPKRDKEGNLQCQVCGFVQKICWPDERTFHATKHWRGVFVTCGYFECFRKLDEYLEPQNQNR